MTSKFNHLNQSIHQQLLEPFTLNAELCSLLILQCNYKDCKLGAPGLLSLQICNRPNSYIYNEVALEHDIKPDLKIYLSEGH